MRPPRTNLLPYVVVFCGVLSTVLIFWTRNRTTTAWDDPPPRSAKASTESNSSSGLPAGSLSVQTETKTAPSTTPDTAVGPLPTEPEAPAIPSEEELTGPLPTREPDEVAPKMPPLHAPLAATATAHDLPALSRQSKLWPAQVTLREAVRFPVFRDGVEAGNIQVPAGTVVLLRKVHPNGKLEVEHLQWLATVPAMATDLLARLKATANTATAAAQPSKPPTAPVPTPTPAKPTAEAAPAPAHPPLSITVRRNRQSDYAPDGKPRRTWTFNVEIKNPAPVQRSGLQGRFFAITKALDGTLTLAANEKLACDLDANGEIKLSPPPLALSDDQPLESIAVLFRDDSGGIAGSSTTRETLTKDWAILEQTPAGGKLLPSHAPATSP